MITPEFRRFAGEHRYAGLDFARRTSGVFRIQLGLWWIGFALDIRR